MSLLPKRIILPVVFALGLALLTGSGWYLFFSTPTSPMSKLAALGAQAMDVKGATLARLRAGGDFADPLTRQAKPNAAFVTRHRIETALVAGRSVYTIHPSSGQAVRSIFYLHGGAYAAGFTSIYWRFLGWLADNAQASIVAPDYPIAPTASWRGGFAMVRLAYQQLATKVNPAELSLMGDSAGGGFALALAQELRNDGQVQPARIILLSPWLDLALANPAIASVANRDPILSVEALKLVGRQWAAGTDPSDFHLSPLRGQIVGLPRISLFSGTADILNPDAQVLHELLEASAIPHDWLEYPDMLHVWILLELPESDQARKQILEILP